LPELGSQFKEFMQGELAEIDVRSILHLVALGQRTGQLWVKPYGATGPFGDAPSWFVFFVQGRIVYAGDPGAGVTRLRGLLDGRQSTDGTPLPPIDWEAFRAAEQLRRNAPEYGCLWALLERRWLQPEQARELLEMMIRETLFELLGLHQGTFIFEMGEPLTPTLMAWEPMPLVTAVAQQMQEWKQFYPQLRSPEQCPVIVDAAALQQALPPATATALITYAAQRLSLRQLAHALNRDLLTVAKAIAPCIQRGWMSLTPWPPSPVATKVGPIVVPPVLEAVDAAQRIVCIDDAVTIGQVIVGMLTPRGYQVTPINDPVAALSQVFGLAPQLILCDIAMPQLDGYELCAMLRQSSQFHHTPIIMLTGKDGFIDRVRAKMVGATDYLAKPFGEDELVMLLEQYLPSGLKSGAKIAPAVPVPPVAAVATAHGRV
jgi:twitching motility two-component system response regulator PilG